MQESMKSAEAFMLDMELRGGASFERRFLRARAPNEQRSACSGSGYATACKSKTA